MIFSYITDSSEKIHKIVTFTVSTLRACALCYATISVDEESKKVLRVINSTPSISYCFEVSKKASENLFIFQLGRYVHNFIKVSKEQH